MAHSSGINNSISFFYAHLPLKKASLLILHWWLCTFDPIMCKWILKKKKKNKIPLSTCTKTFASKLTDGLRENTEVFQTPAQQH